jgi:hypothetical protein
VHKLTENARFFAQKPHFLHIFAGGRDDFLAGRKWGFSGVRAGARGRARVTLFVSRFPPQENAQPHRTVFDLKNRTVALTQHSIKIGEMKNL